MSDSNKTPKTEKDKELGGLLDDVYSETPVEESPLNRSGFVKSEESSASSDVEEYDEISSSWSSDDEEEVSGEEVEETEEEIDPHPDAKWYVVHTYYGHEDKVKKNIEKIVESKSMEDTIIEVEVPLGLLPVENKDGKKEMKLRKLFPGYVLVRMYMNDQSWFIVRNTRGVTGFIGAGTKPTPLTKEEMENMGLAKRMILPDFSIGDSVVILDGPYKNQHGVVQEVNKDKQKVSVSITMFERGLSADFDFNNVTRIKKGRK